MLLCTENYVEDVAGSFQCINRKPWQEGSCRHCLPPHTENYVEDVAGSFQCEVNKPYLLYRNKDNEVGGHQTYFAGQGTADAKGLVYHESIYRL